MNWCVYWALNSLCRLVATLYFSTIYSVVIFYDVFIFFLRCLDARYYVVLSHFFARLNEAKFRLLQSGKLHQEVDREVSR